MRVIIKLEEALTFIIDKVVTFFFFTILCITIIQVLLRYGLNTSILGGNESMEGLFIYTTALGASLGVRRKKHIRIDYLVSKFGQRAGLVVDSLGQLLVAALNGYIFWLSLDWISQVGGHESPVMRIPEWIFQLSVPLGCFLVMLYSLYMAVRNFLTPGSLANEDCSC